MTTSSLRCGRSGASGDERRRQNMPIKRRWPDFPTMRDRPLPLPFARALVAFQHCANAHGGRSDEAQKNADKAGKGGGESSGLPLGLRTSISVARTRARDPRERRELQVSARASASARACAAPGLSAARIHRVSRRRPGSSWARERALHSNQPRDSEGNRRCGSRSAVATCERGNPMTALRVSGNRGLGDSPIARRRAGSFIEHPLPGDASGRNGSNSARDLLVRDRPKGHGRQPGCYVVKRTVQNRIPPSAPASVRRLASSSVRR